MEKRTQVPLNCISIASYSLLIYMYKYYSYTIYTVLIFCAY